MFHRNHRPTSHRFRDKRRCTSKIERKSPIFPPRVFNAPAEGVPLGILYGAGVSENWNDGAFRWSKKFSDRFSRFDTIPECDSQPPSHVAVAITLNAKASSLKTTTMTLPDGVKCSMIGLSTDVLTQHQHWTEGRTDGRKYQITIACQILTRDKKQQNINETRR